MPKIIASVVIMIGRSRVRPAVISAVAPVHARAARSTLV